MSITSFCCLFVLLPLGLPTDRLAGVPDGSFEAAEVRAVSVVVDVGAKGEDGGGDSGVVGGDGRSVIREAADCRLGSE